jgi:selenocysteine lyase/cysteine desulfurase
VSSKDLIDSENKILARRSFLKTAGVTVAGSLSLPALAKNLPEAGAAIEPCGFSSLPTDFTYLNSGTEGSMPECVINSLQKNQQQWAANPTYSYELDPALGKHQHQNRTRVAKFLGVEKNNICLTDNTTMGLSMTVMGLHFQPGDKVIITNHEHTAITSPLGIQQNRNGIKIVTRSFPTASQLSQMNASELLDSLFPNTPELQGAKALCVSHVYPTTGVRFHLKALRDKAKELNISYLIVDGAQAMGMVDLSTAGDSVTNCDFYACPGHKWLNGPPGTGILYLKNTTIRPPEFFPILSQRMGKYADCSSEDETCFPMAEALQVRGCSNAPGFAAMIRAIDFLEEMGGAAQAESQIMTLSREIKTFLHSQAPTCLISPHTDSALESGLTSFFPFQWNKPQHCYYDKETSTQVVTALLSRKIQVRSIGFEQPTSKNKAREQVYAIRVSTGLFNTQQDIVLFKQALKEILEQLG